MTHCCRHIVTDTNVSPFARASNICCGLTFCVRDTKNVSDFVQKYSVSATNVSQFVQPKKHHGQQCVPWQTRTHCCGHIVADTNFSPYARASNICCGHKFCVRDTKNVSDFVQKYFVAATNVSQFAQPKKHHGQQCVLVYQGLKVQHWSGFQK